MRKWSVLCLSLVMLLAACGRPTGNQPAPTWQEQYDLGIRYLSEGNYQEAIIAFTAAIEINPKMAPAFVGRGQAHVLSGESEDNLLAAQADFEAAVQLDMSNPDAWLGLADIFIRQGDYEKALEVLQRGAESTDADITIADKINEIVNLIGGSTSQNDTEEYDFETQIISDGLSVDAENLTVRVRDARSATITVSGISLKDSYLTNLSTSGKNAAEYSWKVEMYGDQEAFSVSTASWAFAPGDETAKSLAEMQHSIWKYNGETWPRIGNAEMNYTPNSITWFFTIPEDYSFDFADVNRYEVSIKDISQSLSLHRVYTLE